jgi:GR25 family glycosyltransferase involved in LPS biosynthesis
MRLLSIRPSIRMNMKMYISLFFLLVCFIFPVLAETKIRSFLRDIHLQNTNSGMDKIDCVYVINLEKRPKKWIDTQRALESFGIHPNRVDAINGWMLRDDEVRCLMGPYPVRLRKGEIGCILSHVSVLNDAHRRNYKFIWVCEDDIMICENPHHVVNLISKLSEIDPLWDVFYTDSDTKNSEGLIVSSVGFDFRPDAPHGADAYYLERMVVAKNLVRLRQRFGAYSMILSTRGIEKILTHFFKNYLWSSYDVDIHYIPGLRQYCVNRDVVSFNYKILSDTVNQIKQ